MAHVLRSDHSQVPCSGDPVPGARCLVSILSVRMCQVAQLVQTSYSNHNAMSPHSWVDKHYFCGSPSAKFHLSLSLPSAHMCTLGRWASIGCHDGAKHTNASLLPSLWCFAHSTSWACRPYKGRRYSPSPPFCGWHPPMQIYKLVP